MRKAAKSATLAHPVYRQKAIAHKEHLMQLYPDNHGYRFCRYYGCGYCDRWIDAAGMYAPVLGKPTRRKPPALIMREMLQTEMFPMTNAEAARALVTRAGRGRKRAQI